jgi:hypothetical protein
MYLIESARLVLHECSWHVIHMFIIRMYFKFRNVFVKHREASQAINRSYAGLKIASNILKLIRSSTTAHHAHKRILNKQLFPHEI